MPFMPFSILGIWFRGLLGIVIFCGACYLLKEWYDESYVVETVVVGPAVERIDRRPDRDVVVKAPEPVAVRRVFQFNPGWNRETALLTGGLALLTWGLFGRWIGKGMENLVASATTQAASDDPPKSDRGGEVHTITRPDGSVLRAECYGPAGAPPVVLTHGWGADSTEWYYIKRDLAERFRLIVWDEPGLGLSKKPDNHDYRLENLAADLDAVVTLAGGQPALLIGHSIGGMIILSYAKYFPDQFRSKVAGVVLVHTTYTNPVRTTKLGGLYTVIEKPVIFPLLYLTIGLWPLVWLMNWISYFNGTAYRSTKKSSFAGTQTPAQVEFVARFMPRSRPDVLARGMLGMIAYDATQTVSTLAVPVLVVAGDRDTTTLPEASQFMASAAPRGELATLSPARHMGLIEHHGRFTHLVSAFADSCVTASVAR